MRRVLILLFCLLSATLAVAGEGEEVSTLKQEMLFLHEHFDVNFVYDSSLDLNIAYHGDSMKKLKGRSVEQCLSILFDNTGINYEIKNRYIILTKTDSGKKPEDYIVFIEHQHDTLTESVITSLAARRRNTTQTGFARLDGKILNRGFAFFSSPDLIKTLQMQPGVSSGTELLSGLYVHGGTGSDNLFLLDKVPMYQVSHLAGLFSSFNYEVIDKVDFYKSGFPARYGGRMSSVVDVMTRQGDMKEYHGVFTIGLIDGNIQCEGPIIKDRTSFNIALRRSWLDVVTTPVFAILRKNNPDATDDITYNFWDANAGITHMLNKSNRLYFNFYAGNDKFRTSDTFESSYRDYLDQKQNIFRESAIGVGWGNILVSSGWQSDLADNIHSDVIAYYTLSRSKTDYSYVDRDTGESKIMEYLDSTANLADVSSVGAKACFDWTPNPWHYVRFGGGYQYHFYDLEKTGLSSYRKYGVEVGCIKTGDDALYDGHELFLYAEDEMELLKWLTVNAGFRYVLFVVPGKAYNSFEPRLALRFQFSDSFSMKASYTEMSQFHHQIATTYIDLPTNSWMPVTADIAPMISRQLAGGFYFNLPYGIHLNLEGWFKTMHNLREYIGSNSFFPPLTRWDASFAEGKGRSYGSEVELTFRKPNADVSLCYTLSWNERFFETIYPQWYPDRNDHRHKLTLAGSYKFTKRFEGYAAWNFHSGSRFTIPSQVVVEGTEYEFLYSSPNNARLPPYHRLDIGLNFRKITKRGNESIWNLSVYNAYCRMNPLFASVEYNEEKLSFVGKTTGVVPIVPTFSYTLRF